MPKVLNTSISAEYETLFEEGFEGLFVQPVGLNVADNSALRLRLGEEHLRMRLVKGSLARRVLDGRGLGELGFVFAGPAAVILAEEGTEVDAAPVLAAKVVAAWRKESGAKWPEVKGGLLGGQVLDQEAAAALEKLPSLAELRSSIVSQILGPGRTLVAQFTAPGARVAGAIQAHIDNQETAD